VLFGALLRGQEQFPRASQKRSQGRSMSWQVPYQMPNSTPSGTISKWSRSFGSKRS
jgi:hypothetical protein